MSGRNFNFDDLYFCWDDRIYEFCEKRFAGLIDTGTLLKSGRIDPWSANNLFMTYNGRENEKVEFLFQLCSKASTWK